MFLQQSFVTVGNGIAAILAPAILNDLLIDYLGLEFILASSQLWLLQCRLAVAVL